MRTLLATLAICLSIVGFTPAPAQPVPSLADGPIEDFLRHVVTQERFAAPLLSPSGRYMLMVERPDTPNNRDFILVFDLDSETPLQPTRIRFGDYRVDAAQWVSDDHLILFTSGIVLLEETPERGLRLNFSIPRHRRTITINRETGDTEAVLFFTGMTGGIDGALNSVADWLPDNPDHVLMMGVDDGRLNLYRVNILTAQMDMVEEGRPRTVTWHANNGTATVRVDIARRGRRLEYYTRSDSGSGWRMSGTQRWRDANQQASEFVWMGSTETPGESFVYARPESANTLGIYRFNFIRGEFGEAVVSIEGHDVTRGLLDGLGSLIGYTYTDTKPEARLIDEAWNAHLIAVRGFFETDESVVPLSIAGDRMALFVTGPRTPGSFFIYDRAETRIDFITDIDPLLSRDVVRPMEYIEYNAADGTALNGYISFPTAGPSGATPLIVMPHGGPEERDELGFNPLVQYLTGLGYAVFQPNFRGSGGYGRAFAEAGHGEWGRRMQSDIDDGVRDLIAREQVHPDQICIIGFSYGGYAALVAAAQSSALYQCAVAGAAPADLLEILDTERRANESRYEVWVERIGHPRRDRDAIEAVSPVELADQIEIPVFLYHGNDDPIVPVDQSRRMARALERANAQYVYQELPGGLHDWGTERDFIMTMRNLRAFLADAMDGRLDTFEPIVNDPRLNGSSVVRDDRY